MSINCNHVNIVRSIVVQFSGLLKRRIERLAQTLGRSRRLAGRVHYLDFFDRLLAPGGNALAPELQFDGTHMAPAYVRFLDEELQKIA